MRKLTFLISLFYMCLFFENSVVEANSGQSIHRSPESIKNEAQAKRMSEQEYILWKAKLRKRSKDFYQRQERLESRRKDREKAISNSIERRGRLKAKQANARKSYQRKGERRSTEDLRLQYDAKKMKKESLHLKAGKLRSQKKAKLRRLKKSLRELSEEEELGIYLSSSAEDANHKKTQKGQ